MQNIEEPFHLATYRCEGVAVLRIKNTAIGSSVNDR